MAEQVTRTEGGDENYFISMTDLMVGLLLIFIVLLMFFALQFKETIHKQETIRDAQAGILNDIQKTLEEAGVTVLLDVNQGLIRLPESVLFESGQATLNERGRHAIEVLAGSLEQALPCYTKGVRSRREACPGDNAMVDAILIEGHTDDVPVSSGRRWRDNLELSTFRATNAYRALLEVSEENGDSRLLDFKNAAGVPVLSVSGYGQHRPIADERAPNRRIDLRLLMAPARTTAQGFLNEGFTAEREAAD